MLELIQGESGIHLAQSTFINQLNQLCKDNNILLIIDEIQTGIGRTGTLFAYEQYGIQPDIITSAKGLANGIPCGAMIGHRRLSHAFDYGSHGSTFGGNKLAMTVAKETLSIVKDKEFLNQISLKGKTLLAKLKKQLNDNPNIIDIRGKGLMIGIETTLNIEQLVNEARRRGLIVLPTGQNVIRLLPPLTITSQQIDKAISILNQIFNKKY